MKLYQQVDIPNLADLQAAILSIIPTNRKTETDLFYLPIGYYMVLPEFREMLEILNLTDHVGTVATTVVAPGVSLPIHEDSGDMPWSLNIPCQGCEGTYIAWYKPNIKSTYVDRAEKDTGYYYYPLEACEEIERLDMAGPAIVNIHTPHGVINPTDQTRILTAIRLRNMDNQAQ